uniref:Uncharacterized protein n=1 Tax=Alexandrium monilatum TaxID=311494 RepID=A0A7S4RZI6_9DINO|mmetsp:Transcript_55373/g.164636  ORF Transcript_55373/g.164636 Transcript_55373/m.164636 type:complete len:310 (-) Transcript_55373:4-933(-)
MRPARGTRGSELSSLLGGRKKAVPAGGLFAGETQRTLALLAVIPWLAFSASALGYTHLWQHLPSLLAFSTCIGIAVCTRQAIVNYVRGGSDGAYVMALCVLALTVGTAVGLENYTMFMHPYFNFNERRQYKDVGPEELADAHRDASAITFVQGSRPDLQASVGYHAGSSMYCVAPIGAWDAGAANREIQYWAAGKDCCGAQGSFDCDDAKISSAQGGLVIDNADVSKYILAVRTAESQTGAKSVPEPIFVRWVASFDTALGTYLAEAWIYWLLATLVYLPVSVALAILAPSALKGIELMTEGRQEGPVA